MLALGLCLVAAPTCEVDAGRGSKPHPNKEMVVSWDRCTERENGETLEEWEIGLYTVYRDGEAFHTVGPDGDRISLVVSRDCATYQVTCTDLEGLESDMSVTGRLEGCSG